MKTAFLCCIHGNLPALEAVDRAIAAAAPDRVVCLGDVIGYGADPRACIDLVQARGWTTLRGNHEHAVNQPESCEGWMPNARFAIAYSMGAISDAQRAWMRLLPDTLLEEHYEAVHGSTHGERCLQYVLTPEAASEAFAAAQRPLVFHGHTHLAMAFHDGTPPVVCKDPVQRFARGARAIIDVGAVGQPRDRDPRASWVLFDDARREVRFERVAYDHAEAARRIRAAGLPAKLADRLAEAV